VYEIGQNPHIEKVRDGGRASLLGGLGYVFDTVVRVLVQGSASDVSAITGMGEFVFALWLLIRGHRIALNDSSVLAGTG